MPFSFMELEPIVQIACILGVVAVIGMFLFWFWKIFTN